MSEVTEPTLLETLEDRLVGPIREFICKGVPCAFVNDKNEHTLPQEEQVNLNNLVEPVGQSALHLWPVLGVREMYATPSLSGGHELDELEKRPQQPSTLK